MKRNSNKSSAEDINSFNDLRNRKKEVQKEIDAAAGNVTKSTEQLLEEGVKVVAVGFVAFLVSRLLNVFMGKTRKPSNDANVMAYGGDIDIPHKEREEGFGAKQRNASETSQEQMNGHHTTLDTARIWLETISGGLEAAKIIIDQISEVQEQMKEKKEKGHAEPSEEQTTDQSNAT